MISIEQAIVWVTWAFFAGGAMCMPLGVALTFAATCEERPLRKGRVQPLFAEPSATVRQKRGQP